MAEPGRRGAGAQSAAPSRRSLADDVVVDLRPPPVAAADAPAGVVSERSDEPVPEAELPLPAAPLARAALSGWLLRSLAPVVVVVVLGSALVAGALWQAGVARGEQQQESARAGAEQVLRSDLERVWSGVLALVAGGVGQQVGSADELNALLAATAERFEVGASAAEGPEQLAAAESRRAALALVEAALDDADGDPVELGNSLTELDAAVLEASEDTESAIVALADRAEQSGSRAGGWAGAAALAALITFVVAAGLLVGTRRRWRAAIDEPLESMLSDQGGPLPSGAAAELQRLDAQVRVRLAEETQRAEHFRRRAARDEWSRRVLEALELVDDEPSVHKVVQRALVQLDAQHPVEVHLAQRGENELRQVASDVTRAAPGCPVEVIGSCVALRRGQVTRFDSSESIDACPHLQDRASGPCSAVCVPVTVAARPVGVVHLTGPAGRPAPRELVEQLSQLSSQVGTRLSALRVLESSRHEASTDGLTGLPNRRTLEARVADLIDRGTPFVLVLADLDKFKLLNDNFGHETGDKALQLFAAVLRDNVRGNDLVARLGGEEFVLVYPNMSVEISVEAVGRIRQALATAVGSSTVPGFTSSFGIAHSSVAADGDAILRVADAGLLEAKDLGGDQAVVADVDLAARIFAEGAPTRASRDEDAGTD